MLSSEQIMIVQLQDFFVKLFGVKFFISYFDIQGCGLIPSLIRYIYFIIRVFHEELSSPHFKLTIKRILIVLFIAFFLPVIIIWNHIGFFLDDIFYCDWSDQSIDEPIFIVGKCYDPFLHHC
jgi:hypothetical protein